MDITTLDQFKDEIYGVKGTPRRDNIILYFRDKRTLFINALGQLCLRHFFLLTGIADLNANAQCFQLTLQIVSSEERNDAGTTGRAH